MDLSKANEPTHYTLRLGKTIANTKPLPNYTPIWVDWHYQNGAVKSKLGYKSWDFNSDGRIDMLEVLSDDGRSVFEVYDFNFDGTIDLTSELSSQE
ncbi:MAG: hypothetical protein R3B45_01830 [Bdellovibrionota bacterium]